MAKVNPKRIPRTQADVERAEKEGIDKGIKCALTIMLYTLHDKFAADDKQLQEFADAFNYTVDSINKGYVTEKDLLTCIRAEYQTEIDIE